MIPSILTSAGTATWAILPSPPLIPSFGFTIAKSIAFFACGKLPIPRSTCLLGLIWLVRASFPEMSLFQGLLSTVLTGTRGLPTSTSTPHWNLSGNPNLISLLLRIVNPLLRTDTLTLKSLLQGPFHLINSRKRSTMPSKRCTARGTFSPLLSSLNRPKRPKVLILIQFPSDRVVSTDEPAPAPQGMYLIPFSNLTQQPPRPPKVTSF